MTERIQTATQHVPVLFLGLLYVLNCVLISSTTTVAAFTTPIITGRCSIQKPPTNLESISPLFRLYAARSKPHNDDPRAFKRKRLQDEYQRDYDQRQKQQYNGTAIYEDTPSSSFDLSLPQQPLVRTIGGGTQMIFAMARQLWKEEEKQQQQQIQQQQQVPNLVRNDASIIWRNVRKRRKAQWMYALRTFDRMTIKRQIVHYEGALVACAKLGYWERAIDILDTINRKDVTDSMLSSIVRASVRATRVMPADSTRRREPLDAAVKVLRQYNNSIPIVARHVNPLVATYQRINLRNEAAALLDEFLYDRTIGPEAEFGNDPLNVHDIGAKNKASYALLVQGALAEKDWHKAVSALRNMTQTAGLYPSSRHLQTWNEQRRKTRSWKKKRDEAWIESVR